METGATEPGLLRRVAAAWHADVWETIALRVFAGRVRPKSDLSFWKSPVDVK
jgi:hypothetical protein